MCGDRGYSCLLGKVSLAYYSAPDFSSGGSEAFFQESVFISSEEIESFTRSVKSLVVVDENEGGAVSK